MMIFATTVQTLDLLEGVQGFQQLLVVIGVGTVIYLFLCKRPLTRDVKVFLLALAAAWAIAGAGLYAYGLHGYITVNRPIYQQQTQ